jgi:hypothetical protein
MDTIERYLDLKRTVADLTMEMEGTGGVTPLPNGPSGFPACPLVSMAGSPSPNAPVLTWIKQLS